MQSADGEQMGNAGAAKGKDRVARKHPAVAEQERGGKIPFLTADAVGKQGRKHAILPFQPKQQGIRMSDHQTILRRFANDHARHAVREQARLVLFPVPDGHDRADALAGLECRKIGAFQTHGPAQTLAVDLGSGDRERAPVITAADALGDGSLQGKSFPDARLHGGNRAVKVQRDRPDENARTNQTKQADREPRSAGLFQKSDEKQKEKSGAERDEQSEPENPGDANGKERDEHRNRHGKTERSILKNAHGKVSFPDGIKKQKMLDKSKKMVYNRAVVRRDILSNERKF